MDTWAASELSGIFMLQWTQKELRIGSCAAGVALALIASCCGSLRAEPAQSGQTAQSAQAPDQAVTITIDEAIRRAEANEPAYASARADSKSAQLDHSIAISGLLPSVTYHNQGLYTQPNGHSNSAGQTGSQSAPIFIANNAVREYASQGVVSETIGVTGLAGERRASAAAARAAAELEIARRGLIATVTDLYYGAIAAENKRAVADRAHNEAADFTRLTRQREDARESAHADVLKAQLEEQQRQRDLEDATLAAEKAHLELGVLLFPDPRTPYLLSPGGAPEALPTREEAADAASKNNPELKSALAALKESDADVAASRGAYLPDLGLNFTYGIDAPQFAVNGPYPVKNLGYSASVAVDLPVWDWLATEHKVKQSEIRRDASRVALTAAQRQMIARLEEVYHEAEAARDQLGSLDESARVAEESLRLTRLRYTGGEATVLEVVDAQNTFVIAENAREDGRVRYEAARADLKTMMGSL
jgi:outer membrane protein TolC